MPAGSDFGVFTVTSPAGATSARSRSVPPLAIFGGFLAATKERLLAAPGTAIARARMNADLAVPIATRLRGELGLAMMASGQSILHVEKSDGRPIQEAARRYAMGASRSKEPPPTHDAPLTRKPVHLSVVNECRVAVGREEPGRLTASSPAAGRRRFTSGV
jgi:hypothetical protein